MPELTPRLSRRQLCATTLGAAPGAIAAGCTRGVGLDPELPTSQSPSTGASHRLASMNA